MPQVLGRCLDWAGGGGVLQEMRGISGDVVTRARPLHGTSLRPDPFKAISVAQSSIIPPGSWRPNSTLALPSPLTRH